MLQNKLHPKEKRNAMKKKGKEILRAEEGRLVGYTDMWGTTPRVMLDNNRMVNSRNCTYDLRDYTVGDATPDTTHVAGDNDTDPFQEHLKEIVKKEDKYFDDYHYAYNFRGRFFITVNSRPSRSRSGGEPTRRNYPQSFAR